MYDMLEQTFYEVLCKKVQYLKNEYVYNKVFSETV